MQNVFYFFQLMSMIQDLMQDMMSLKDANNELQNKVDNVRTQFTYIANIIISKHFIGHIVIWEDSHHNFIIWFKK